MSSYSVKKIDNLGRIVIPMDIRKKLSIKKDDSLEFNLNDDSIILKKVSIINKFDDYVINLLKLLVKTINIKVIATNRENIIFNNSDIEDIDVNKLINMSLIELVDYKENISSDCDIRPIIIDSNVEGVVIVLDSSNNELLGKIINILLVNQLDISF